MSRWSVQINDFLGGLAPGWYRETYPSYGNKNMAAAMTSCDLSNPGYVTNGPYTTALTNGTQAAAVTTKIKSILDRSVTSATTYGTGGNKLYKIITTTVTSDGTWPHTINHPTKDTEDGEDVCEYQGNLYYSYNNGNLSGVPDGDIGIYDLASTFNDDWASTVPSGAAALEYAPHQMIVGGNDVMYIANGRYVASWDGTTFMPQALDLPTGSVISSLRWLDERLYIFANKPALTGSNKNTAHIYVWDGTTNSWESSIKLNVTVGGSYVWNGVVFFFYYDVADSEYTLAYLQGLSVVDVTEWPTTSGSLPTFGQVTTYKNFLIWLSGGTVYAYGSGNKYLPARLFKYTTMTNYGPGSLAAPFGTVLVAYQGGASSYACYYLGGSSSLAEWDSLLFDVSGETGLSRISTIIFNFEKLTNGAILNLVVRNSLGNSLFADTISYAKLGAVTQAVFNFPGLLTQDFRIELDWDATVSVKVKSIKVFGESGQ